MDEHPGAAEADCDSDGNVRFGTNFLHLKTPDASIIIDPGGWSADHVRRLTELHPVLLEDNLVALGIDPSEVTHVLVSHGHPDHFQGVLIEPEDPPSLRFRNARHYFHRLDVEGVSLSEDDRDQVKVCCQLISEAGLLSVVEGYGTEVVEGVDMIHTGGESAGHCVVRIKSDGDTFIYLADLIHLPEEARHLDWAMRTRNTAELVAGRRRVFAEAEAAGAVLMYTHDPAQPPWGSVSSVGVDRWSWLTVT
jgi:glyoxylase-like metal-dependent hydrolase (beta-lactamase superfamily II)